MSENKKITRKSKKVIEVKKPTMTPQEFFASVPSKPEGMKHVISCKCFLPQFKDLPDPPEHRFVVFSELDEFANVKMSYAQCNNCGIIHKILEIGKSAILKKEDTKALETIEEIGDQLPDWMKAILQKYDCDLPTFQEARFILINQLWGRYIVLTRDRAEENLIGKVLMILGERLHKIETFEREEDGKQ